jgi:methionine sulfoxide reductase heme-binding subunit
MSHQALWYVTRGSGVVALLLLTATTLLGVLSSNRWRSTRWPRFAVADLHRNLTLLAIAFIGIHVGTTIADVYAPIGVKDVFIPFASLYRPVWLGLGTLALDLLLAIVVTSLLRQRVGYRVWRALHWAAYATWPLALAHGLGTGSDARFGWMAFLSFSCMAAVIGAVAVRLVRSGRPELQLAAGAATVALAILLVTWYQGGPAKHGWAAKAGTPKSLLKRGAVATATQLVSRTTVAQPALPFDARMVGRMSASGPDQLGDAAVAIAVAVRGSDPGLVRLTLWGSELQGGGIAMNRSQVSYQDAVTGTVYTGSIVALEGGRVVADVASSSGARLRLAMILRIDSQARTVTGSVHVEKISEGE